MPYNKEKVILVDENDNKVGTGEKLEIHQRGILHRAFSVLLFNQKGEILLQKRAKTKYHSAGLWSNTCCSHPRPDKDIKLEAERRLKEEMGIECDLKEAFKFIYKVKLGELIENEVDHVFFGDFDGRPKPKKKEVEDYKWINLNELRKDVNKNPKNYTYWFRIILKKINAD
jgi:isopentenyl-diphosphate delta-isomerase